MTESIHAAFKEKQRLTQHHLLGISEQILGRVPSNAEIAQNVRCNVKFDGSEEFFWDNQLILKISPMQKFGGGKALGWEFEILLKTNEGEE